MTKKGLYIQMFSIHGLIRSQNIELGRDADTGGQILYVLELAKQLSQMPEIRKVDLFTRLIADKTVSSDYAEPVEKMNDKCRIVRIRCGGTKYIRKELLWPHLEEFIDKTIIFIKGEKDIADVIHGHYADAGYVSMRLAKVFFGTPFLFTGHSLGRAKKLRLLEQGVKEEDMQKKLKIDHRIAIEEEVLKHADSIITSTVHEQESQYGMYRNKDEIKHKVVIPPGVNLDKFRPFYHGQMPEKAKNEKEMFAYASVMEEMNRFFQNQNKPIILTICRPEKRKNISGLIESFGQDQELQAMANLAIFAGIRKDISLMADNERDVLTEMLLLMDKYDLYGKMAIPKKNDFEFEVPALYHIVAEKRGVFTNVALHEPFGLTLIEASASGLPVVATNDGGPVDIIRNLKNGILVDPSNPEEISRAIKKIITNHDQWKTFSRNGIINVNAHYSWKAHATSYLNLIKPMVEKKDAEEIKPFHLKRFVGKRLTDLNALLVTDIDGTLIGEDNRYLSQFSQIMQENYENIGFAVATGRDIHSTREFLERYNLPPIDIYITSVGTEIHYGNELLKDKGWHTHIFHKWHRERIKKILDSFDFLTYQEEEKQTECKISYYYKPTKDCMSDIHNILSVKKLKYTLICSGNNLVDILPYRASKGKAVRYISYKWNIPLRNMVVCGDSGNDEEMLRGDAFGVVVANHYPELDKLKKQKRIYFSQKDLAGGIIEGLAKSNLLQGKINIQDQDHE